MKAKALAVAVWMAAVMLFGAPGKAAAQATNSITLKTVSQNGTNLQIQGVGTYSVAPGSTMQSIYMTVLDTGGHVKSNTIGVVTAPNWSSISDTLPAGTYNVYATMYVVSGGLPVPVNSATLQITIK